MTVNQAIAQVDRLRPNQVPTDVKIGWLADIDHYVHDELYAGREGADELPFERYTEEDGEKNLLIPEPYCELYLYKLEAMLYYEQREIKKYASSMAMYNQAMHEYSKKYVREHRQKPCPTAKYW